MIKYGKEVIREKRMPVAVATSNDFGIVVIGRNEGKRLIVCLQSPGIRWKNVVYVDSGSTDGSVMAAEQLGALVVKLDMARSFTAARARNEGFAALKSHLPRVQYVQFIDGDCELFPDWIDTSLKFITKQTDVAIVCGRVREIYPESSIYNGLCNIEWDTPIGEVTESGGIFMARVEAFEMVGGFRSQLIAGEEPELCVRLREAGWKIWRIDAEMTRHDAAIMRFSQWWLRAVRGGHAYAEVWWLHKRSPFGIYERQIASAVFWGGLLPLLIGLGALMQPLVLLGVLIYPFQMCRIALRRGMMNTQSWIYASFMMVGKFAEFQGILKFLWRHWCDKSPELLEHKRVS